MNSVHMDIDNNGFEFEVSPINAGTIVEFLTRMNLDKRGINAYIRGGAYMVLKYPYARQTSDLDFYLLSYEKDMPKLMSAIQECGVTCPVGCGDYEECYGHTYIKVGDSLLIGAISVEGLIWDKLSILYTDEYKSRACDLYDLHVILSSTDVDLVRLGDISEQSGKQLDVVYSPFHEDRYSELKKEYEGLSLRYAQEPEEEIFKQDFYTVMQEIENVCRECIRYK